jgi:hypothetical protein
MPLAIRRSVSSSAKAGHVKTTTNPDEIKLL